MSAALSCALRSAHSEFGFVECSGLLRIVHLVGIRTALKLLDGGATVTPIAGGITSQQGVRSPFVTSTASKLVWSDILGTDAEFITRAEAMTLPPIVKGRAVIVGIGAPAPLVALGEQWRTEDVLDPESGQLVTVATQKLADQPAWLYRTSGQLSPLHRMIWTLDDLIFSGMSLWALEREGNVEGGEILEATRVPIEWWKLDATGRILVNDEPVQAHEVCLFTAASEGLLEFATRSVRGALLLEHAWVKRARNPIPLVEIHETVDNGLQDGEAEELVQDYMDARDDVNGLVTFTPYNVELKAHGESAPQLAIEGRNFVKVDVANFLNLPAAALDGSLSTASLTYSTKQGARNEVLDSVSSYWLDPIGWRLSQDDMTAPGTRIRSDFGDLRTVTPSPTGPSTKD